MLDPVVGRARVAPEGFTNGFGVHIADVEVDPETGKTTILRYTAIQDAGKAIHPSYVEGQMQGGAVQGIGWALNEEYWFDDKDRMWNASFLDYRMPTALDVPMIETIIVEVPNPNHPFGVRGVGETPIVRLRRQSRTLSITRQASDLRTFRCRRRKCGKRSPDRRRRMVRKPVARDLREQKHAPSSLCQRSSFQCRCAI